MVASIALLAWLALFPERVQTTMVGFAVGQVDAELRARLPGPVSSLDGGGLQRALGRMRAPLEERLAEAQARRPDLRAMVAWVAAAECGCARARRMLAASMALNEVPMLEARLAEVDGLEARLAERARERYRSVVAALKVDLTIFLATNLAAFALVLAVASLRRERARAAVVPAFLILVAVGLSSGIYLFGQDWFYAILYGHFMGGAYLMLVGLLSLALLAVFCAPKPAERAMGPVDTVLNGVVNALSAIPLPGC